MKILILEPHGDDAVLSCNSILETDNDIDIVTFSDGRTSEGLMKYYPSIKSTRYVGFDNLWFPDNKPLLRTYDVHRDYNQGKPIARNYDRTLIENFGEDYYRAENELYGYLVGASVDNYDLVLCCSGISHPYHVALRNAMIKYLRGHDVPVLWYGDKYYLNNRYAKEFYETLPEVLGVDSEINEGYEEISDNLKVQKVMEEVYPTELKLFRFYSPIILNCKCKYYYDSRYMEIIDKAISGGYSMPTDAIEHSDVCEEHYTETIDPWGNREFGRYTNTLRNAVVDAYNLSDAKDIKLYDIGCGGGNVLDVWIENKPDDVNLSLSGCDISETAIKWVNEHYDGNFEVLDVESYDHNDTDELLANADIISLVDVMYLWGAKKHYSKTMDELWETVKPGAIFLVADTLVPYQRRSYLKNKEDSETLEEFTESSTPVGSSGKFNRYLKVKIYRKMR